MASVTFRQNHNTAVTDSESDYGSIFTVEDATAIEAVADHESDYGSEVDDDTAIDLLSQAESQPLKEVVLESIEDPIISNEPIEEPANLRLPSAFQSSLYSVDEFGNKIGTIASTRQVREASVEVEYDQRNRTAFSPSRVEEKTQVREESLPPDKNDSRSPLEKFRTYRPISVTDLVSPAWCELQYEENLSKYGRVRKTPAMKQGSSVHKELEEQVYVQVPVEVVSAEDKFALRIWNTIQGLRSLRETGLTRELEVWGVLEGEVVIGIIDEITTKCPDEAMEEDMLDSTKTKGKGGKGRKTEKLHPSQSTLTDFLTSSQNGSVLEKNPAFLGTLQERPPTCYIVDVKTRQSRTLPAPGSQSRPTHMQLMIYHRLLSALAANEVPADKIFERYRVQPNERFSDKFIAEVANLDVTDWPSSNEENISPKTTQVQKEDSLTELLEHNTLSLLWSLLVTECARTLPIRLSQSPISPLLTAEFRTARTTYSDMEQTEVLEAAGTFIGRRCFELNSFKVDTYVRDEMSWWKGERQTKGVDIEEAYKCRICEFADGCKWREEKVEEGLRKAKLRAETRRRSEV